MEDSCSHRTMRDIFDILNSQGRLHGYWQLCAVARSLGKNRLEIMGSGARLFVHSISNLSLEIAPGLPFSFLSHSYHFR